MLAPEGGALTAELLPSALCSANSDLPDRVCDRQRREVSQAEGPAGHAGEGDHGQTGPDGPVQQGPEGGWLTHVSGPGGCVLITHTHTLSLCVLSLSWCFKAFNTFFSPLFSPASTSWIFLTNSSPLVCPPSVLPGLPFLLLTPSCLSSSSLPQLGDMDDCVLRGLLSLLACLSQLFFLIKVLVLPLRPFHSFSPHSSCVCCHLTRVARVSCLSLSQHVGRFAALLQGHKRLRGNTHSAETCTEKRNKTCSSAFLFTSACSCGSHLSVFVFFQIKLTFFVFDRVQAPCLNSSLTAPLSPCNRIRS